MSQKISEMNNSQSKLPPSWRWVRLGEVCETTSGGTPSRGYREYYEGSIPWVKSGELNDGFIYSTEETITELGLENSSAKLFPKETLLIALYGATVGKLGILKVGAATNQAVCAIFPNHEIDRNFLFFYLLFYRHSLLNLSFGGAQPNISQELVRTIMLPLPPLSEQKSIAAKVQELMQEVGRARTACEKQLEAAKSLPSAYLREVFESEKAKKWERKKLGDVIERYQYGFTATSSADAMGYPLLRISDIYDDGNLKKQGLRFVKCDNDTYEKYKLEEGDVLIARSGSVGRSFLYEGDPKNALFASYLIRFKPRKEIVDPKFLFYFTHSGEYLGFIDWKKHTLSQPNINAQELKSLEVLLPSLPIQQRIAAELKEKMACVGKLLTSIEKQLEAINVLPQAILRKAFRGEL